MEQHFGDDDKSMAFPSTNWKYLNCSPEATCSPGTEINVTPESAVQSFKSD
jgi:hypothetical protein